MITAKPTEHLTGITLSGEYQDFHEIVEAIYRMTGLEEDYNDRFYGVKSRLLGICYEIRHAYMGDRDIELVENGVDDEIIKWHERILPGENLHYSVNLLFPEAVFIALAVSDMYIRPIQYYGERGKKSNEEEELPVNTCVDYLRDKAVLDLLCTVIISALAEVIGDEETEKLLRFKNNRYEVVFADYVTHYLDKCNVEYMKTEPEKRKDKLRNIAKKLIQKPAAYSHLKEDMEYSARYYNCSIYELHDPKEKYSEEIEW